MKGTNLGELEEIVLLIAGNLYDVAYGVAIKNEIEEKCERKITISTVHNFLQRLQERGFLESRYSGPTKERGGKRKLLFRITKSGQEALVCSRSIRESLRNDIQELAFKH